MPSAVRRLPLSTQTADVLLGQIRSGRWALGSRLPAEPVLAASLGVGRTTLREAVRELSGRGVLESRQGAGVFVVALDASEDWDAVLGRAAVVKVIEARVAIEAEAAALAAAQRTPNDLRAIRRALASRAAAPDDVERLVDADTAFHRSVVAASHNEILLELFDSFVPRVHRAMVAMLRARPVDADADHAAHEALVEAVAARLPERASAASRAHLTHLKEALA